MSGGHGSETVSDKVGFGVVVGVAENVGDCNGVRGHEPAPADEAAIDKSGAVCCLPVCDEVCIFLIVHLAEVAHEEGRRGRAAKEAEGGEVLAEEEANEAGSEVEKDDEGDSYIEKHGGRGKSGVAFKV